MANNQSEQIKAQNNRILEFLKENLFLVVFFIVNSMVTLGLYFIYSTQEALSSNIDDRVNDIITNINKAQKKIEDVEGKKILLFQDEKKFQTYEKTIGKFIESFGKQNLKIMGNFRSINITKIFPEGNSDNLKKAQDYVYWLLSNNIKAQVMSYPLKQNKFVVVIYN